ncbi:hypothetical protein [Duncaniella muris]|nr:hypothetical protein [Duncaniella muris]
MTAEENGASPAEAEKIAAEAEKAYDGSENPQAEAYDILDKDKGTGA